MATRPFNEFADEVKATWDEETWELYRAAGVAFRDAGRPKGPPASQTAAHGQPTADAAPELPAPRIEQSMSAEPRTTTIVTEPSAVTGRWIVYRPDADGPIVTVLVDESGWGWTYGFASVEPRFDVDRQAERKGFVVNVLFATGGSTELHFSSSEPSTVSLATSGEVHQWIKGKNESRTRQPFTSNLRTHLVGISASLIMLTGFVILRGWDPLRYLAALTPLIIWAAITGYTEGVSRRNQFDARLARVSTENDAYRAKARLQDSLNAGEVPA